MKKQLMLMALTTAVASTAFATMPETFSCEKAKNSVEKNSSESKVLTKIVYKTDQSLNELRGMEGVKGLVYLTFGPGFQVVNAVAKEGNVAVDAATQIAKTAFESGQCSLEQLTQANPLGTANCLVAGAGNIYLISATRAGKAATVAVQAVGDLASGVLNATSELSKAIADAMKNHLGPVGQLASVPFVVLSWTLDAAGKVVKVAVTVVVAGVRATTEALADIGCQPFQFASEVLHGEFGNAMTTLVNFPFKAVGDVARIPLAMLNALSKALTGSALKITYDNSMPGFHPGQSDSRLRKN